MKKKYLFLFGFLLMFGLNINVNALEQECTKEAAIQLAKIVYHEVGSIHKSETGYSDDLFAQLTTASIALNNASSKAGSNWYEKLMNLTDNNYSGYSNYKNLSFDEAVGDYKGRMLYVAQLVLNGRYNVPKNLVFQAADYIVLKEGREEWTHIKASPNDVYFGYPSPSLSDVDVFGRTVKSKEVKWYKNLAKSYQRDSYDDFTTSTVCGGVSDNSSGNTSNYSEDIDVPVCENPEILKVIYFASIIVDIVKIIVPIGLVAMAMLDFSKGVTSGNESDNKKNLSKLIKRFIYAILIFAVPWIVKILIINLGNLTKGVNYTDCLENATGDKIKELEEKFESITDGSNNYYNRDVIFVGDSRTYQMCFSVEPSGNTTNCSIKGNGNKPFAGEINYYIAEGSRGYKWFEETAVPAVNSIINSGDNKYTIISLMGVNGVLEDINKYEKKYKELSSGNWKNQKIVLVSIMPVEDDNIKNFKDIVNNKNIEAFNNRLKGLSTGNISYCDIYTTMKSNMNKYKLRDDGLHYTTDAYKEIYNLIGQKCF